MVLCEFLVKQRLLLELSLQYVCRGGGGNCAFRVTAAVVFGDANKHLQVRRAAVNAMPESAHINGISPLIREEIP